MANPDAQQPQLSLAKFAPLIMMFLLNKFDLDKLGYRQHAEAAFLGVQVGCVWVLSLIEKRIREKPDGESERNPRVKIPAEVVMGKEAKPARDVSQKEYDREKFGELRMQQLMGAVILGAIYYKWRSLLPLVLQTVMTPLNLMDSPLFQIYMLQRNVNRPFPKPNPFGLPEAPAAPTETPELEAVANPTELTCLAAAFGVARDVSGAICCAQPSAAEEELSNKSDMDGKVAVVTRGIVPFIDKARRVADAGAVALIVVNSEEACYKCTAPNEDCSDLNIPVVCVGCSDGQALKDGVKVRMAMAEGKVTLVENAAAAEGKKER